VTTDSRPRTHPLLEQQLEELRLHEGRPPTLDEWREFLRAVDGAYRDSLREFATRAGEIEREGRAKSAFLANMTHELRTPLTSIIGFSEMLEDGLPGPLTEKQSRYVGNILTSARHLLRLVGEILDLARMNAGHLQLVRTRTDLGGALRRACAALQPVAAKKRIAIVADTGDQDLSASADEPRIDQILYSLLTNAVKFTPDGGRVDATARRREGTIVVSIRDNGVGIESVDIERIFHDFVQTDSSFRRAQAGAGLGLALTRGLVELHGGQIHVESVVGSGSAFTFSIPCEPPAGGTG
jgi:signal transduction histidine kinase